MKLRYKDIKSSSISRKNEKSVSQNKRISSKSPVEAHQKKASILNQPKKYNNAVEKHRNIESVQIMPK